MQATDPDAAALYPTHYSMRSSIARHISKNAPPIPNLLTLQNLVIPPKYANTMDLLPRLFFQDKRCMNDPATGTVNSFIVFGTFER
jgi:hypothetical protein